MALVIMSLRMDTHSSNPICCGSKDMEQRCVHVHDLPSRTLGFVPGPRVPPTTCPDSFTISASETLPPLQMSRGDFDFCAVNFNKHSPLNTSKVLRHLDSQGSKDFDLRMRACVYKRIILSMI